MSPSRFSLSPVASVRLPPPLSPATIRWSTSIPSSPACSRTHFSPATQSFSPAGNGATSGADEADERIAEVDHRDGHALRGDHPAPRPVHAVEARHRLHAAAVDVVDARQRIGRLRPDELDLDRVAVRLGHEFVGRDGQTRSTARPPRCRACRAPRVMAACIASASGVLTSASSSSRLAMSGCGPLGIMPISALMRGSIRGSLTILLIRGSPCPADRVWQTTVAGHMLATAARSAETPIHARQIGTFAAGLEHPSRNRHRTRRPVRRARRASDGEVEQRPRVVADELSPLVGGERRHQLVEVVDVLGRVVGVREVATPTGTARRRSARPAPGSSARRDRS